jgi:hypothetical protein
LRKRIEKGQPLQFFGLALGLLPGRIVTKNLAAAPFVWTGFSGFEWKDCSVVVVAVGM